MRAQLSDQDKAVRARQNALNFENNATVMSFYDRAGKQVGRAFGERALYEDTILSPDRTRVALIKDDQDNESADLYVLELGSGKNTRLTTSKKTEFVQSPVWSPDGKQLAYVEIRDGAEGVYRRSADGTGPEELLYKNPGAFLDLADWSRDGRYMSFAKSDLGGGTLFVLPLAEGEARQPREIFRSEMPLGTPRFSPDGRYLSYIQNNPQIQRAEIFVRPLEGTGAPRQISDGARSPAYWRSDGKELYYMARDFDVMAVQVNTSTAFEFAKPAVLFRQPDGVPLAIRDLSRDGERFLVMMPPRGPQLQQITIFDREGRTVSKVGQPGAYSVPSFSPDGSHLVVMHTDLKTGSNLIVNMDVATGKSIAINDDTHPGGGPIWSLDGKYILYTARRGSGTAIAMGAYRKAADGTGDEELLFRYTPGAGLQLTDISPDGKYLLCASGGVLLIVPLTGTDPLARKAIELRGEFSENAGRFSPDGKFIAYRSDEDDALKGEVYVRPFDAATGKPGDGKWRVSKDGVNAMIHWRADGKEIFFRGLNLENSDLLVMSAEVSAEQGFHTVAVPKVLFRVPGPLGGSLNNIRRDGQRFVFAVNVPVAK
jgi:Tol biopolymer transport system component